MFALSTLFEILTDCESAYPLVIPMLFEYANSHRGIFSSTVAVGDSKTIISRSEIHRKCHSCFDCRGNHLQQIVGNRLVCLQDGQSFSGCAVAGSDNIVNIDPVVRQNRGNAGNNPRSVRIAEKDGMAAQVKIQAVEITEARHHGNAFRHKPADTCTYGFASVTFGHEIQSDGISVRDIVLGFASLENDTVFFERLIGSGRHQSFFRIGQSPFQNVGSKPFAEQFQIT